MKLLLVLFIFSLFVPSTGCASQEEDIVSIETKQQIQKLVSEEDIVSIETKQQIQKLVSEVQSLREEVNQLKCHYHRAEYPTSYPQMDTSSHSWALQCSENIHVLNH